MNLLTSSLSTSFSVPSSPSWALGGMETDATISDETDKRIGLNSFVYYFSMTYTSMPKECQFPFELISVPIFTGH